MLANNIGYIKIDEFSGSALEEYQQAVAQLQEQGMQAMILDLRDNPCLLYTSHQQRHCPGRSWFLGTGGYGCVLCA